MGLRVEVQAQDGTREYVQVRAPQQPCWGGDGSAADLARCCWQSLPKAGYFEQVASCMDEADVRSGRLAIIAEGELTAIASSAVLRL